MVLSCQQLYVQYNAAHAAINTAETGQSSHAEDWWGGEPPLSVESPLIDQLFGELRAKVEQADVLVLEDREWLQDDRFSNQIDQLLAACRARGGEIRYSTRDSMTPV